MKRATNMTRAELFGTLRRLVRLVPEEGLVLTGVEEDYELGGSRRHSERLSRKSLIVDLVAEWPDDASEVTTFEGFRALYVDFADSGTGWQVIALESQAEADARAASEERERLREEVVKALKPYPNALKIISNNDPRASALKIVVKSGYTDDWGQEGLCVYEREGEA
jgi:hypothetical protein